MPKNILGLNEQEKVGGERYENYEKGRSKARTALNDIMLTHGLAAAVKNAEFIADLFKDSEVPHEVGKRDACMSWLADARGI